MLLMFDVVTCQLLTWQINLSLSLSLSARLNESWPTREIDEMRVLWGGIYD